jgi:D-glycerate 3-kinase
VVEWRTKQERELARSKSAIGNLIMSEEEIRRFIMHYERVTGFMLKEMPGRADVTLTINDHHEIEQIDIPE